MASKEQAFSISAIHLKGGCGKTTLLTDVGMVISQDGRKVLAVDSDVQGSMYTTLTGNTPRRYLPNERKEYLDDLRRGDSIKNANTPYLDVNKNLVVCHYPVQMFAEDKLYRPEFKTGFVNAVEDLLIDAEVVLVDLPPSKLESDEASLFKSIEQYLGTFYFLVVTRPTVKELGDGLFCFEAIRHLMAAEGIGAGRIKELILLNFHEISVPDSHLFGPGKQVVVESAFPSLMFELHKKKLRSVSVPNVPRSGRNLFHYSVLLDENFDWGSVQTIPSLSDAASMTSTDFLLSYGDQFVEEIQNFSPELYVQREYLKAIRTIVSNLQIGNY